MLLKASLATLATMVLSAPGWAQAPCATCAVPEVSSNGSLAAIVAVAALAAILYERRRRA